MSFLFASSHLPAVKRPQDADEEEEPSEARQTAKGSPKGERSESTQAQPMQRSGGVRAISHLEETDSTPESRSPTSARSADSAPPASTLGAPTGELSQRSAQPVGRSLFMTPRPPHPQYFAQMQARRAGNNQQLPPTTTSAADSAPGQGATPTFRNLQQRSSEEPPAQLLAQPAPAKTGAPPQSAGETPSSAATTPASATPSSSQSPAPGRGPTPVTQSGAAPQQAGAGTAPQGGGSLARYRLERQKLLDSEKNPSKETQTKIASITRNMESIQLAAHLINHTKQEGEADIDPESIDENSDEYKNKARTAISRLHGGSAPWMDHLAANFGEREGPKGGPANPRLVKALGIDPTAAAWCGSALGKSMSQSGIKPPNAPSWAGNWRKWGTHNGPSSGGPHIGDVYHIKYPDDTGHVTTVVGVSKDGTQLFCLGGNQNDGVNIAAYPIGQFNDPKAPDTGKYKGATIVYKKPQDQKNATPAPTFDYNADSSSFNTLAHLTR
jgi:hypothetical protein